MKNREVAEEFIDFALNIKKFLRAQVACEGAFPITEHQFRTLMHLKRLNKCNLKELSESVHISSSSICIMLNKLFDEDLVLRETDPKDRRNTYYSLSVKGHNFLNEILEKKLKILELKIEKLSDTKKESLITSINELNIILDELK